MSTPVFETLFVLGAGAIALWTHVRFPGVRPAGVGGVVLHAGVALVVCTVAAPLVGGLVHGVSHSTGVILTAVLGIYLPALSYGCLSGIWAIAWTQEALSGLRP